MATSRILTLSIVAALGLVIAPLSLAASANQPVERIEVTGSRIKRTDLAGHSPVMQIRRADLEQTGLSSVGEILQDLTTGGKALSSQFNSSGNFGSPPDGGGIGAGSAQVDLRHLEAKRVLVLVDGQRWVNETSASGIGGAVDLNTLPLAIIERVEVLEDGASAIYGSDAIAGVINIITRKNVDGVQFTSSYGQYQQGDGQSRTAELTFGGSGERFSALMSASYNDQQAVSSGDRALSRLPVPGTGVAFGSSRSPQGRFGFCDPSIPAGQTGFCDPGHESWFDITPNVGAGTLSWDPNNPDGGSFHAFGPGDRFNFAPYNLLLTPNRRQGLFGSVRYEAGDALSWTIKALYNNRQSANQAAPEPLILGPDNGSGTLADRIFISRLNPYNPFGIDLDPAVNFGSLGRRPLEAGPRIFEQEVDTYYLSTGLQGRFEAGEREFSFDVNYLSSQSRAEQAFKNSFNLRRIALALGDPAQCALHPGCVPLNLFGGMGVDGRGTITPEMLSWVRMVTRDASEQKLQVWSANLTGDLLALWAAPLAFASGYEWREYEGSYSPDRIRTLGESNDASAIPSAGRYQVSELFTEFNLPMLRDAPFAQSLELSAALRYSDYSNFGSETTAKYGVLWRLSDELLVRGSQAEGFRAPFIGELYGLGQFGATLRDPCTGAVDDGDGPASTPVEIRCRALGVPSGYAQLDPQITTTTGGSATLAPESSVSDSIGVVYSPDWLAATGLADSFDIELSYYQHAIDEAIQAPDAQDKLNACVAAGAPTAPFCQGISRNASGNINRFNNLLANIGQIETSGWDVKIDWTKDSALGRFTADLQATKVRDYAASDVFGNDFSRRVGVEINDSAIPTWQSTLNVGLTVDEFTASWTARYIAAVHERCGDALDFPVCDDPLNNRNELAAMWYHNAQLGWNDAFALKGLLISAGVHNLFDEDPPECLSCTLNGYDAGTYELPGRYYYLQLGYRQ